MCVFFVKTISDIGLTCGADYYINHKINLNLISYLGFQRKKYNIQTLQVELKIKKDKSSEINPSNEPTEKPSTKRKKHL